MKILRKTGLWLMAAAALVTAAASCSRSTNDEVPALLASVPSSASSVTVVNTSRLLDDLGCKVNGMTIKRSDVAQQVLDSLERSHGNTLAARILLADSTGTTHGSNVVFSDAYATYMTGLLDNSETFKAWVEKRTGEPFSDNNGVQSSGNVAFKGTQYWICTSRPEAIDQSAVGSYAALKEAQSFASNTCAKQLEDDDHDLLYWGDVNALIKNAVGSELTQLAGARVVLGMLFEDATYATGTLDCEKGMVESSGMILNSKGEPAKYLLPEQKIDMATVESLGGEGEMLFAMGYPAKLTEKIKQLSGSLGGALPQSMVNMLSPIDGTIAFVVNDAAKGKISGVITTDGKPATDLSDFVTKYGTGVKTEGKLMYFGINNADIKGPIDVKGAAEQLKGTCLGMVVAPTEALVGPKANSPYMPRRIVVGMYPEDGSMDFKIRAESRDNDSNMAVMIVEEFLSKL